LANLLEVELGRSDPAFKALLQGIAALPSELALEDGVDPYRPAWILKAAHDHLATPFTVVLLSGRGLAETPERICGALVTFNLAKDGNLVETLIAILSNARKLLQTRKFAQSRAEPLRSLTFSASGANRLWHAEVQSAEEYVTQSGSLAAGLRLRDRRIGAQIFRDRPDIGPDQSLALSGVVAALQAGELPSPRKISLLSRSQDHPEGLQAWFRRTSDEGRLNLLSSLVAISQVDAAVCEDVERLLKLIIPPQSVSSFGEQSYLLGNDCFLLALTKIVRAQEPAIRRNRQATLERLVERRYSANGVFSAREIHGILNQLLVAETMKSPEVQSAVLITLVQTLLRTETREAPSRLRVVSS